MTAFGFLALLLTIAQPAALPARGAKFLGPTAQKQYVSFSVARTGPRLTGLAITVYARCDRAGTVAERRVYDEPVRVEQDGSFSAVSRGLGFGGRGGDLVWVRGRFTTPRHAEGTVLYLTRRQFDRFGVVSCTSGTVTWSATAR
jgi:hypothetical protein